MKPRVLTVLGATGTIGVNTLDVVARHPERFEIFALTGATQVDRMFEQCRAHRPRYAVMTEATAAAQLRERVAAAGLTVEVLEGSAALTAVATAPEVDTLMAAIVGAAGLPATLAAAQAGKRILLANKETLVVSGQLFMDAIAASGAELLPIDSEHNAIFQSLPRDFNGDFQQAGVKALWLTASGGPFRTLSAEAIAMATPAQAVAHPNWVMGKKISVDSASLMNKGLEVIEARWLFNARPEQIKVVVHPQSIVHSMVEYADGSVLAQMGTPDMRTPIAYALGFPERIEAGVSALELMGKQLTFEAPDTTRFPCLQLAFDALAAGGNASAVLNAANEVAVARFLDGAVPFSAIAASIAHTLEALAGGVATTLEDLLDADRQARAVAESYLNRVPA
ncbi:1-deoxy-D-xylulose-5-phosphate reductoisomerase [Thiobacillus sp.]|uniref:1-deoxy-D-xylulose-5-phosphate reductoisomerase n=1 Tax=Thiobacillus sp. TaxID=924 RepID=UPI0025E171C2|nr:1-deoxy-D-xylulose-5-phosphate reductoisomerase [Thiobacillus sp.]